MIKFGFIVVVVYFVCFMVTKWYAQGLSKRDQFKFAAGLRTTRQNIWLIILGILRLAALVFGAIAVILFLWRLI